MYPNGVRTTTKETCSGIYIEPGHVAILCECDLVTLKDDIDHASLRGVEMLRHLPIAVSQFDINGKLMEENPEALGLFGGEDDDNSGNENESRSGSSENGEGSSSSSSSDIDLCGGGGGDYSNSSLGGSGGGGGDDDQQVPMNNDCKSTLGSGSSSGAAISTTTTTGDDVVVGVPPQDDNDDDDIDDGFTRRFVDRVLGRKLLRQIQDEEKSSIDVSIEAQQHTKKGPRWSAIKLRKSKDIISQEPIILYSARDITDVIHAKNEADRANMEKSEMLAVLAHEIRTPLHQVIGFIDLLMRTVLCEEQLDVVRHLQSSTTSLMSVINDVLDFTKLEAGKMEIERIPFDPCLVCEGCIETTTAVASNKGLRLVKYIEPSILGGLVMGDPNRIRQILLNLLSNAIKFTPTGGEIALSLQHFVVPTTTKQTQQNNNVVEEEKEEFGQQQQQPQQKHVLKFSVKDTGMGIPEEHIEYIFNKYKQTDASVSRKFGGTGLGLAICKSLSEAMDGSIQVTSKVQVGSEFSFEIPVEICDPETTDLTTSSSTNNGNIDDTIMNSVSENQLNVLVAEDNKVNQKLVASMLKHAGHVATIVDNGALAVEAVEQKTIRYDIILMDVQMPIMDGFEATKMIRSKGWSKAELPIIGLTASFQTSQLAEYQEIGMNYCIGKPVRMKALREVIEMTKMGSSQYN